MRKDATTTKKERQKHKNKEKGNKSRRIVCEGLSDANVNVSQANLNVCGNLDRTFAPATWSVPASVLSEGRKTTPPSFLKPEQRTACLSFWSVRRMWSAEVSHFSVFVPGFRLSSFLTTLPKASSFSDLCGKSVYTTV